MFEDSFELEPSAFPEPPELLEPPKLLDSPALLEPPEMLEPLEMLEPPEPLELFEVNHSLRPPEPPSLIDLFKPSHSSKPLVWLSPLEVFEKVNPPGPFEDMKEKLELLEPSELFVGAALQIAKTTNRTCETFRVKYLQIEVTIKTGSEARE